MTSVTDEDKPYSPNHEIQGRVRELEIVIEAHSESEKCQHKGFKATLTQKIGKGTKEDGGDDQELNTPTITKL